MEFKSLVASGRAFQSLTMDGWKERIEVKL